MKSLYYVGEKTVGSREDPKPIAKPGQYLIQVRGNGICGSDFEVIWAKPDAAARR